jgi:hypothetical protein
LTHQLSPRTPKYKPTRTSDELCQCSQKR